MTTQVNCRLQHCDNTWLSSISHHSTSFRSFCQILHHSVLLRTMRHHPAEEMKSRIVHELMVPEFSNQVQELMVQELAIWESRIQDLTVQELTIWDLSVWNLTVWKGTVWKLMVWKMRIQDITVRESTVWELFVPELIARVFWELTVW